MELIFMKTIRVNKYVESQKNAIATSINTIERLEKELRELKQQLRVQEQLSQAQITAENELEKWLEQGKKLLKDCSSVFPVIGEQVLPSVDDDLTVLSDSNILSLLKGLDDSVVSELKVIFKLGNARRLVTIASNLSKFNLTRSKFEYIVKSILERNNLLTNITS
jgi:alcohol dehydrogenase class IV